MSKRWMPTNGQEIISRYREGESSNALAKECGVARMTLHKYLQRHDVAIRGIGEANVAQATRVSPEARKRRALAAQEARRGQKDSISTLEQRARSHQATGARVGRSERELDVELRRRGFVTVPQLAVGRFNIDIAVDSVAVEVHSSGRLPHHYPRHRERIQELAGMGWHSIYVMAYPSMDISAVAAQVEAHLRDIERDPDSVSQYVLIRRGGGLYPVTYSDTQ